jgi:hypothetical protein
MRSSYSTIPYKGNGFLNTFNDNVLRFLPTMSMMWFDKDGCMRHAVDHPFVVVDFDLTSLDFASFLDEQLMRTLGD